MQVFTYGLFFKALFKNLILIKEGFAKPGILFKVKA